jgi:hypothetical protein
MYILIKAISYNPEKLKINRCRGENMMTNRQTGKYKLMFSQLALRKANKFLSRDINSATNNIGTI